MGSGISLVLHFFSVILTKGSYFEIRDFLFVFPEDEAFLECSTLIGNIYSREFILSLKS